MRHHPEPRLCTHAQPFESHPTSYNRARVSISGCEPVKQRMLVPGAVAALFTACEEILQLCTIIQQHQQVTS